MNLDLALACSGPSLAVGPEQTPSVSLCSLVYKLGDRYSICFMVMM